MEKIQAPAGSSFIYFSPFVQAPQSIQKSDLFKDEYLRADIIVPAILTGAWALIQKFFAGKAMDVVWKKIFPKKEPKEKLTAAEEAVKDEQRKLAFYTARNFFEYVEEIKFSSLDITAEEALRAALKYVYEGYNKKYKDPADVPEAMYVTFNDIKRLKKTYGFTDDQIRDILYQVNANYGRRYDHVLSQISSAITDSSFPEAGREIVDTQEIIRKHLEKQKHLETEVIKSLFKKLIYGVSELPLAEG